MARRGGYLLWALLVCQAAAQQVSDVTALVSQGSYRHFLNDLLYTHAGDDRGLYGAQHDLARESIRQTLAGFGLETRLEAFQLDDVLYYNVVAVLPGKTHPERQIIVGAHYDSVDNPGANDDGTGVSALLEAARVLTTQKYESSLVFAVYDREEQGLIGSTAYANRHANDQILAMLDLDMFGHPDSRAPNRVCLVTNSGQTNSTAAAVSSAISQYGAPLIPYLAGAPSGYGSDYRPFAPLAPEALLVQCYKDDYNHTPRDSVETSGNIDYAYGTAITRGAVAFLAGKAGLLRSTAPRVTGPAAPGLEHIDSALTGLLTRWNIPGAALAVVRQGRLLLARGYGLADQENGRPVQPDSLFRIGGLSQTVTTAAILKLVEQGKLNLDSKALEILSNLQPPEGQSVDPRLRNVTVRDLLYHTAGWNEDSWDPDYVARIPQLAAHSLGNPAPADPATMTRYAIGKALDFDPGARFAYSNLGYVILGRIAVRTVWQDYEPLVKSLVLAPAGITRMSLAGSLPGERLLDEVRYYDYPGAPLVQTQFAGQPSPVAAPDGGLSMASWDSAYGWTGSAVDLVRLAAALDASPLAQVALQRPPYAFAAQGSSWYGLGRWVDSGTAWYSVGHLPGSFAWLSSADGIVCAALFNSCPKDPETFRAALQSTLGQAFRETASWPDRDFFAQYAAPAAPFFDAEGVSGGTAVAPGKIVEISGTRVGPAALVRMGHSTVLETRLAGTRVRFDNVPAPLLLVSDGRIATQVPYSVTGSSTQVRIEHAGAVSETITVPAAAAAPEIFAGAILNADFSPNGTAHPAGAGSVVSLFATGLGQTDPAGLDGRIAADDSVRPRLPVAVLIGEKEAEVLEARSVPGLPAGIFRIRARIPAGAGSGERAVRLMVGAASSPDSARIWVR